MTGWDLDFRALRFSFFVHDYRSESVACGGESSRLPHCPCSVKKQCGEAGRERKRAKEKESQPQVEDTQSLFTAPFAQVPTLDGVTSGFPQGGSRALPEEVTQQASLESHFVCDQHP